MESATLWQEFAATGDLSVRDQLLNEHLGLVHHVARQLSRSLSAEAELDAAFEALAVPEVPSSLERRLLDVPKRVIRPRRAWLRAWFVPAVGWAAAAAVGLWIGGQLEGVPNGNGLDDSEAWVELAAGELAVLEEVP